VILESIEASLSDESKMAELLGVSGEEYAQLDHRDKIIIRDALSVYMTDFWKEYGRLMGKLPLEDKIAG
jgi:hypothetical protein